MMLTIGRIVDCQSTLLRIGWRWPAIRRVSVWRPWYWYLLGGETSIVLIFLYGMDKYDARLTFVSWVTMQLLLVRKTSVLSS